MIGRPSRRVTSRSQGVSGLQWGIAMSALRPATTNKYNAGRSHATPPGPHPNVGTLHAAFVRPAGACRLGRPRDTQLKTSSTILAGDFDRASFV
jgi:hypothetical protein